MHKRTLLPLLALVVLLVAAAAALPARAQSGPNLLENPGFEDGHYNQDGIPQITVPNGWRMYWSNEEKIFGGEWVTTRPETIVWNIKGSPPGEEFFWKDGSYTMKVFNTWAPLWAAMAQDVENLQVGRKYRFSVPIYIDVFADYESGKKIPPPPEHLGQAKIRLGAGPVGATWRDETAIAYSGWWTDASVNPFYQAYPVFVYDFTATQPNMTVYIEMVSAYPFPNNGFFFDTPSLVALDATGAVPAQPAAPAGNATGTGQAAAPPAGQVNPVVTIVPPTPRPDGSIVHVVEAGDREEIEQRALPFHVGDEVLLTIEEPHMYNVDDAVARVDSYIVSVTNAGPHVGEQRMVRIESVGRSAATASLLDSEGDAVAASGNGADEQLESASGSGRRRRGSRGGRRRSRASSN